MTHDTSNEETPADLLAESRNHTTMIREWQEEIVSSSEYRRMLWYHLWETREYTQIQIAEACNVTRGVVYKEIKRYKEEQEL